MEEVYDYEEYEETSEQTPPKKKRKAWIWIVAAVLVLAVLAAGALLLMPKLTDGKNAGKDWYLRNAYLAVDQSAAYIVLPGGEVIKVKNDGVVNAKVSADLQHVGILLDDGTLYVADQNLQGKKVIAENAQLFWLGNSSVFYYDKDNRYHRSDLKGKDMVDLPKDTRSIYVVTDEGKLSAAFEGKNAGLYTLPDGAEEWSKVGSDLNSIRALSDDGNVVLWSGAKNGKYVQYISENEEKFSLGEFNSNAYSYAMFSKDQKLIVAYGRNDDEVRIWIKQRGKDVQSVKLSGFLMDIVSNRGRVPKVNASQIKYLYVTVKNNNKSILYRISLTGDKEKILSKVNNLRYLGDSVAYLDEDGALFVAKMGKKELDEAKKLAGDVEGFALSGEGKYLYYLRSDALYGYKIGAKEATKIASDVEGYRVSENGQYVVIMKDGNSDTGFTLFRWKFGDKSPSKFASDATVIQIEDSGEVYYRHLDGKTFDLMYYNGKETRKLGTDIWK